MIKLQISYRNAKGHIKAADPFNCPEDAPEEVRIAAAAVAEALGVYGPPISADVLQAAGMATEAQKVTLCSESKRGRGRPVGYRCNEETINRMKAAKKMMWQQIKATMSEFHPDQGWGD